MKVEKARTYADCMLYTQYPQYNVLLMDAIMHSDRVDKNEKEFDQVVYEIKRAHTDASVIKVLESTNSVLYYPGKLMPKPFKVFCAKDLKDGRKIKAFIDVSNIVTKEVDGYKVNEMTLLSHLINAKFAMYYTVSPKTINRTTLKIEALNCFAQLFTHIIDYVGKISTIDYAKDKCLYLSARYFGQAVMGLDEDEARTTSRKISGITETKESRYDFMVERYSEEQNPFLNIKAFVKLIAEEFKIEKLTLDIVAEKWMYLYGQGTVFALEFYPALAAMMTDAYCGAYINNQKTIEKICAKHMIEFAKEVIYHL